MSDVAVLWARQVVRQYHGDRVTVTAVNGTVTTTITGYLGGELVLQAGCRWLMALHALRHDAESPRWEWLRRGIRRPLGAVLHVPVERVLNVTLTALAEEPAEDG